MRRIWLFLVSCLLFSEAQAQVGEYRTDLAVGVNGGYMLSNVGFVPDVPQGFLGGLTGGLTVRYTCEKYFKSICSVVAEVNIAHTGWKESIEDAQNKPVRLHTDTTQTLAYQRKMTYVQIPLLARLGWGRERKGFQGFFQVGPQVGVYLRDKTVSNFDPRNPEFYPGTEEKPNALYQYGSIRTSHVTAQDTLAVENKFDYGIVAGAGLEYSHPKLGHFLLEARYYYGLGNIYGNTKSDYFGKSNFGQIVVKATWLFDIIRTKNSKIK